MNPRFLRAIKRALRLSKQWITGTRRERMSQSLAWPARQAPTKYSRFSPGTERGIFERLAIKLFTWPTAFARWRRLAGSMPNLCYDHWRWRCSIGLATNRIPPKRIFLQTGRFDETSPRSRRFGLVGWMENLTPMVRGRYCRPFGKVHPPM